MSTGRRREPWAVSLTLGFAPQGRAGLRRGPAGLAAPLLCGRRAAGAAPRPRAAGLGAVVSPDGGGRQAPRVLPDGSHSQSHLAPEAGKGAPDWY